MRPTSNAYTGVFVPYSQRVMNPRTKEDKPATQNAVHLFWIPAGCNNLGAPWESVAIQEPLQF